VQVWRSGCSRPRLSWVLLSWTVRWEVRTWQGQGPQGFISLLASLTSICFAKLPLSTHRGLWRVCSGSQQKATIMCNKLCWLCRVGRTAGWPRAAAGPLLLVASCKLVPLIHLWPGHQFISRCPWNLQVASWDSRRARVRCVKYRDCDLLNVAGLAPRERGHVFHRSLNYTLWVWGYLCHLQS
jgi:hypothetical protein